MNISIRPATPDDMVSVFDLVNELAVYERAGDQVKTSAEEFIRDGFGTDPAFGCLVAVYENRVVGFALYYTRYSTWNGKVLYLEDLLVTSAYRGKGIGKMLFDHLIVLAREQGMRDINWQVLDWNEPAINFYKKYDAILDPEWINGKLVL